MVNSGVVGVGAGGIRVPGGLNGVALREFFRGHPSVLGPDGAPVWHDFGYMHGDRQSPVGYVVANLPAVAEFVRSWGAAFDEGGSLGDGPLNGAMDRVRGLAKWSLLSHLLPFGRLWLDNSYVAVRRLSNGNGTGPIYEARLSYDQPFWDVAPKLNPEGFESAWWYVLGALLSPDRYGRDYSLTANPVIASVAGALRALAGYVGLTPIDGGLRTDFAGNPTHSLSGLIKGEAPFDNRPSPALRGATEVEVRGQTGWKGDLTVAIVVISGALELFRLTSAPILPTARFADETSWELSAPEGQLGPSEGVVAEFLRSFFGDPSIDDIRGSGDRASGFGAATRVPDPQPSSTAPTPRRLLDDEGRYGVAELFGSVPGAPGNVVANFFGGTALAAPIVFAH